MSQPKQLTTNETFFIGGETANVYQHTGGLVLLDASDSPDFSYRTFRAHVEERTAEIPHFRWKLHEVPFGADLPYWVEDEDFSFDHHVKRIAVPAPGDREALAEVAAFLYSKHLDRSRPLWETWFIEGLPRRRFAVLQKLHHAMMDGEGASQLGARLVDVEPGAPPRPVDPAISGARPGAVPSGWRKSVNLARRYAGLPAAITREVLESATPVLRDALRGRGRNAASPDIPVAHFNREPVGRDRSFVFCSLPLADLKAVKNHFGVKLNDVVLALVGTALRNYLGARDLLPESSLRGIIAVSLRTSEDDAFSNHITTATADLGTTETDLATRLRLVAADTEQAKEQARHGGKGFMEYMQVLPPIAVGALLQMARPEMALPFIGGNVMVSNVRGSPLPMYQAGAKTTAMYPLSIITPGSGINVTCVSYLDNLDVGITMAPSMFPEPWELVAELEQALRDYRALTRKRASQRGKRSSARAAKAAQAGKGGRKQGAAKGKGAKGKGARGKGARGAPKSRAGGSG